MSFFYDIFSATKEEVAGFISEKISGGIDPDDLPDPLDEFMGFSAHGITDLEIGELLNLMVEPLSLDSQTELVIAISEQEGPWLIKHPKKYIELFSAIADLSQEIDELAHAWVASGSMKDNEWSVEDAIEVINGICQLTKFANENQEDIYQWIVA